MWPNAANAVLGVWLATAPATFTPHPPALVGSDIALGHSDRRPERACLFARVSGGHPGPSAVIGLWLMAAPLVFWAPTAAAYATDTLIGTLVVVFAVAGARHSRSRDLPGPDVPPGWSYNPSAWPQRAGIIALAFVQFFVARHLAAYQLRHIGDAWDPFFGDGTRRVSTRTCRRRSRCPTLASGR